jgi:hypothetical protein
MACEELDWESSTNGGGLGREEGRLNGASGEGVGGSCVGQSRESQDCVDCCNSGAYFERGCAEGRSSALEGRYGGGVQLRHVLISFVDEFLRLKPLLTRQTSIL